MSEKEVAIADAVYVLTWLMQVHERRHKLREVPENIRSLACRALKVLGKPIVLTGDNDSRCAQHRDDSADEMKHVKT